MRTLPSVITTALAANDITVNYLLVITWTGVTSAYTDFGVVAGTPSDFNLSYNESPSFWSGDVVDMIVKSGMSRVSQSIPIEKGGGIGIVSDFNLSLVNDDRDAVNGRLSDLIETVEEVPLYHRDIKIYFALNTSGASTIADTLLLWQGRIHETGFDLSEYRIRARSGSFTRYRPLLENIVENSNSGWSDFVIPEENQDKPIPIVYGDMNKARGYYVDKRSRTTDFTTGQTVIFSDGAYACKNGKNVYVFQEGFSGFEYIQLPTEATTPDLLEYSWNSNESLIEFDLSSDNDSAQEGLLYLVVVAVLVANGDPTVINAGVSGSRTVSDPQNVYDNDFTTVGGFNGWTGDSPNLGEELYVIYRLPKYSLSGDNDVEKIYIIGKFISSGPFPDASSNFDLLLTDNTDTLVGAKEIFGSTSIAEKFDNITSGSSDAETDLEYSPIPAYITGVNSFFSTGSSGRGVALRSFNDDDSGSQPSIDVYECRLRMEFTLAMEDAEFYADIDGVEDDGSGTITGSANILLQQPQHIIRHIEEVFLGATMKETDSLFNTGTVDVDKGRYYWIFANQVLKNTSTKDLINDICKQSFITVFDDYQSSVKAKSLLLPQLVENNEFITGTTDWTSGTGWSIANAVATATAATGDLDTANDICTIGSIYLVVFELSGFTAGTVTPTIGTASGTARSTDGVHAELITGAGTGDLDLSFVTSTFTGVVEWVTVTENPSITIDESHIRYKNGIPTTGKNAVKNSPISQIYTEYEVNYAWDNGKDRFLKTYYVRAGGTVAAPSFETNIPELFPEAGQGYTGFSIINSWYLGSCELAYTQFDGLTQKLIIDADWIQDPDTAIRLVQAMIDFHSSRKKIVKIETRNDFLLSSGRYSLELEEGDTVFFNWAYIPDRDVSGIDTRYFQVRNIETIPDQNNNVFQRLTFQEIGDVKLINKFVMPALGSGFTSGFSSGFR